MERNEVIQAKKVVTRIVGAGLGVNCLLHLQKERLSLITGEVGWLLVRRILEEDVLVAIVPHELLHILFLLIFCWVKILSRKVFDIFQVCSQNLEIA